MLAAPYLIDRSNAPLFMGPSRPVPGPKVFTLVIGPLLLPALIAGFGIWAAVENTSVHWSHVMAFTLTLCGIATLFLAGGWSASWGEYRLLRHGRVILGEVVAYSAVTSTGYTAPVAGGGEDAWVQVTVTMEYAFTTPSGMRLTGRAVRVYTEAYSEPEVRPGNAMAVLYLDDETFQAL